MDTDILFWLGLLGFWIFRMFSRKKKPGPATKKEPPAEQQAPSSHRPRQGVRQTVSASAPVPDQPQSRPAESEFDLALREIRKTLGMRSSRQPDPHPPPRETFGQTEEHFERQKPYTETRGLSEERFEQREAGSSRAWDSEEEFELRPRSWEAETTYDTSFDRQPAYSEVDFHDRYRDISDSPYEYRSPLKKKTEAVKARPTDTARPKLDSDSGAPQSRKRSSIADRLRGRKSLREAALLLEILGPPVSRRNRR